MPETNLTIIAYKKGDGNRKVGEIGGNDHFTVDFNPHTFTVNSKIDYNRPRNKGQAGGDPQFEKIPPIEFSIEFTIDGTGVAMKSLSSKNQDDLKSQKHAYVKTKIKELRGITGSDINGEIHRPNYLALLWGTFYIECILTSLNIVYNLFDREGSPLRAKVTCNFLERYVPGEGPRRSKLESSDLTKQFVVKEGDILPLIAKNNYESSSYYLQIAKANKLKNFRNITPGMKLILPPIVDRNEQ
ncbi:MAG: LysM peptidoglycan-binding domain-containing protein [Chitinophagaceae bacterium]